MANLILEKDGKELFLAPFSDSHKSNNFVIGLKAPEDETMVYYHNVSSEAFLFELVREMIVEKDFTYFDLLCDYAQRGLMTKVD